MEKTQYQSNDVHTILGYTFIVAGIFWWVIGWYAIVASKFVMPETGHVVLDWFKSDQYFMALLPSWVLTILIISSFNWVAMKYFRHA